MEKEGRSAGTKTSLHIYLPTQPQVQNKKETQGHFRLQTSKLLLLQLQLMDRRPRPHFSSESLVQLLMYNVMFMNILTAPELKKRAHEHQGQLLVVTCSL